MYSIAFSILCVTFIFASCLGIPRHHGEDEHEDMSIDSSNFSNDENEALNKLPDNGKLFEGDIVMDERLRRAVWGEASKKSAIQRKEGLLWPEGRIHYEIDKDFPPKNRKLLAETMDEFQERTCIRFEERTNQKSYVFYTAKKDECSSNIGRSGGQQNINLGRHCLVLGTFEHENMHALGFIHEHSRPDRDKYIEVKYVNIEKKEWGNFQKYKMDEVDNLKEDFNFASVLLYRNDAFTKNGKDTITALDEPELQFGQRIKFSIGDVKEINNLYNCTDYKIDPNYHGLYKEYHIKKRRKDTLKKRILDKLWQMERRLYLDKLERY